MELEEAGEKKTLDHDTLVENRTEQSAMPAFGGYWEARGSTHARHRLPKPASFMISLRARLSKPSCPVLYCRAQAVGSSSLLSMAWGEMRSESVGGSEAGEVGKVATEKLHEAGGDGEEEKDELSFG